MYISTSCLLSARRATTSTNHREAQPLSTVPGYLQYPLQTDYRTFFPCHLPTTTVGHAEGLRNPRRQYCRTGSHTGMSYQSTCQTQSLL